MDQRSAPFVRRAAAGAIDAALCFAASIVWAMAWLYAQLGSCDCPTAEDLQDYTLTIALASGSVVPTLMLVTVAVYALWSWTPLSGRRSIGMRASGIRVVRT